MEKELKNLILELELQKLKSLRAIDNLEFGENNSQELINTGKILAYDYCILELQKLVKKNN